MPGWEEEDHQKAMTAQHDIHCSLALTTPPHQAPPTALRGGEKHCLGYTFPGLRREPDSSGGGRTCTDTTEDCGREDVTEAGREAGGGTTLSTLRSTRHNARPSTGGDQTSSSSLVAATARVTHTYNKAQGLSGLIKAEAVVDVG